MSNLTREHGDLPAMMGIVRNQIPKKGSDVGTKVLDPAVGRNGVAHQCAQRITTCIHGLDGSGRRYVSAFQCVGDGIDLGSFEPHHPDVVNMGDNRSDGPAFAIGSFGFPRLRRKILDEVFRDPIVDLERVHECGRKLAGVRLRRLIRYHCGFLWHDVASWQGI